MQSVENQIAYAVNFSEGSLYRATDKLPFEGKPCPTKEAFKLIGKEGVEFIDKFLKAMTNFRNIMFHELTIKENQFPEHQHFIHCPTVTDIYVTSPLYIRNTSLIDNIKDLSDEELKSEDIQNTLLSIYRDEPHNYQYPDRLNKNDFYEIRLSGASAYGTRMINKFLKQTKACVNALH